MNHSSFQMLATLLDLHLLQLQDNEAGAEQSVKDFHAQIRKFSSPEQWSLWLWGLSEQIERFHNNSLIQKYKISIENGLKVIQEKWMEPQPNAFTQNCNEISTFHLGIYYAALSGMKRTANLHEVQPTITAIRDLVFSRHLKEGMLIQSQETREVSSDLLFTVMPFGLFSPEDLVVVEAVNEIEKRLVTSDGVYPYRGAVESSAISAFMLSWYYFEKGTSGKASTYFDLGRETKTGLEIEEILQAILQVYMNYSSYSDQVSIVHHPYGYDNPYEPQVFERIPRDPIEGENVAICFKIESIDVCPVVKVKGGGRETSYFATYQSSDASYWYANIGSYQAEEVSYWIEVTNNGQCVSSNAYSFIPLQNHQVQHFQFIGFTTENVWLSGKSDKEKMIYVGIERNSGSVHTQFKKPTFKEPFRGSLFEAEFGTVVLKQGGSQMFLCDTQGLPVLQTYYDKTFPMIEWTEGQAGFVQNISWHFYSPLQERFFGMGERYHKIEYRGEQMDCYVYNQYRDQGSRTYMPVPFFLSSQGYGLHVNTAAYSKFDFADEFCDLLTIQTAVQNVNPTLSFKLYLGDFKTVISSFTNGSGPAQLPPIWAFGPWMSSNNWDRDSVDREQVKKTNELSISSTVLVIEQWSDEATYYIFNDAVYDICEGKEAKSYKDYHFPAKGRWPDPKGMIDYLHENGLKVILWQIPIQKYMNRQHHSQKDEDERFMIENGYCVMNEDGTPFRLPEGWFKESLLMDFSNPKGAEWWFQKRQYLLDIGVDGFKTDGGEFVFGRHKQFSDGRTGKDMRNLYPNSYIEAYYRFATDYHNGNAMTFSRAGYTGAQRFPAHWAGDERSTFDAFRRSLIAGLSAGISGISMWGWDLAGFNGDIPTAELFIRSAQMAAFCPIMQYHAESKGEFNQDRTPWNIAERTGNDQAIDGYRFYANVRMNLLPYIVDQAKRATENGLPLMRPLFIDDTADQKTYEIYDQYRFGEHLLVAPITEEGALERKVYFPEGKWVNLFHYEVVEGPCYKRVSATLMEIPVFVRAGSAFVANLNANYTLGSWVGNDCTRYQQPVLLLYSLTVGEQAVVDHLGNRWEVRVQYSEGHDVYHLQVDGDLPIKIKVCGEDLKGIQIRYNLKEYTVGTEYERIL